MFTFPETITDAPTVTLRTAGLQSKSRDQMKIPPYLRSLTEELTHVPMANRQLHNQYHQKNKNINQTTLIITLTNNYNHKISS